jgi:hypothetical protein
VLLKKLKQFSGTEFDAAGGVTDNEQLQFLVRLMDVLKKVEWKQIDWKYSMTGMTHKLLAGSPDIGEATAFDVHISVHKESLDKLKPAGEALIFALREIGVAATGSAVEPAAINNANPAALHLIVGRKQ